MWKLLAVLGFVVVFASAEEKCVGDGCQPQQQPVSGLALINRVVRQYLDSQPADMVLGDGVHLVSMGPKDESARAADDGSLLTTLENFLRNHELRIRLPELMPDSDTIGRNFRDVMEEYSSNDIGEARRGGGYKGGKKGNSGILLMALMMGKTLAAIGFGTVGLLAMKALMVSALALMLSIIVGLKKLISSGHDEGGHTVIHATHSGGHEHHRRKREAADMAYAAWSQYLKR